MKHVVSVSLGTSQRDKSQTAEILGQETKIERIGCDGDLQKYADTFRSLDGKVDAIGVGGADIYLSLAGRRYVFKQIAGIIAANVKTTPVVDGSGLKHTLERETIRRLQRDGTVDFKNSKTLLVSAVDRFGMAEALVEAGGEVTFGDFLFAFGLPIPVRKYSTVLTLGKLTLPLVTSLPFKWVYPTGKKQEERKPKFVNEFLAADVIAGDWHYIHRYMPDEMPGKIVITQTLRKADFDLLKSAGVSRVITTTPVMGGETFATNVMEAVIVSALGKKPDELKEADYFDVLERLNWKPSVIDLQTSADAVTV